MLVNLNDVLLPAQQQRYGVGLFNTVNLEMARGVLAAAERTGSAVIIGTAEVLLPYGPLEELSYFLLPMARKSKGKVVVHYDHGLTFDKCIEALKLGFSSVMYDCSMDSYEDNIKKVKELTYIAHGFGASVEGELGHVGGNEAGEQPENLSLLYTDPEQARDYTERTGIDALAIAVGTAHGVYKYKPKLDFERIAAIRNIIDVPLVLHGGSGLSDNDFKKAIACGISKVNIFTDLNIAASHAVKRAYEDGKDCMTDIIPYQVEDIAAATENKIRLFRSSVTTENE